MINQIQRKSRFSATVPKRNNILIRLRVAKLRTLGHRKRASCFCHALHKIKPQGITINNRIKLQMEGKPSSVPRHSCWLVGELHGRHVDIPPSFLDKTNQLGVDFFVLLCRECYEIEPVYALTYRCPTADQTPRRSVAL